MEPLIALSVEEKNTQTDSNSASGFPQRVLSTYIETLSEQLKNSEKVIKNVTLKSSKWTKSCYDLLSSIIAEELNNTLPPKVRLTMGVSLSAKTLQKIVTGTYKLTYPIDPRTLNSLNKVVFFLGYIDWNNFVAIVDEANKKDFTDEDPEIVLTHAVEEAIRLEHQSYCQLPDINEESLTQSYLEGSPSYNLIMDVLMDKAKNKQVISNTYNPSSYEILNIEVEKIKDTSAQVFAKVYWLLCWWDSSKERYVKRYKNISNHYYVLQRDENRKWMIKTNASIADNMKIVKSD